MGYAYSGFSVVGIDQSAQPDFPFRFFQGDAMATKLAYLRSFDLIHASPPCQVHSTLSRTNGTVYPDLVEPTRELLQRTGVPYVIENVVGSPLVEPTVLCGEMFGLQVVRHRLFETSFHVAQPRHVKHQGGVRGNRRGKGFFEGYYFPVYGEGSDKGTLQEWSDAMGIWHIRSKRVMAQAIPPAFTHYIAQQFLISSIWGRK